MLILVEHCIIINSSTSNYMSKLMAVNFSATQEIDRQQQADKLRIATLEAEVTSLKSQIASILQRLDNGGL